MGICYNRLWKLMIDRKLKKKDLREDSWEYGDVGTLISSISWYPRKLRVVQDFLDELNRILEPIKSKCDGYGMGNWYITDAPFAIATWDWTEDGFKITGTEL